MATLSIKQKPLKINYNLLNSLSKGKIYYSIIKDKLYLTNGDCILEMKYNKQILEEIIDNTGAVRSNKYDIILKHDFMNGAVNAVPESIVGVDSKGLKCQYYKLHNGNIVKINTEYANVIDKEYLCGVTGTTIKKPLMFDYGEIKLLVMPVITVSENDY